MAQAGHIGAGPDYSHYWVSLADAYLKDPNALPPGVRDYFSALTASVAPRSGRV